VFPHFSPWGTISSFGSGHIANVDTGGSEAVNLAAQSFRLPTISYMQFTLAAFGGGMGQLAGLPVGRASCGGRGGVSRLRGPLVGFGRGEEGPPLPTAMQFY